MKVYIFFNGDAENFPPGNEWEKFPSNFQDIRLFNFAAASWRENGFEPVRLTTHGLKSEQRINFLQNGQGPAKAEWYPREWWQLLAAALVVCRNEKEPILVTSLDVQNLSFKRPDARRLVKTCNSFVNFQAGHFSLSTFIASERWLQEACWLLRDYDNGLLPAVQHPYVSDEMILRHYAPISQTLGFDNCPVQHFEPSVAGYLPMLLHHSRSITRSNFNSVPYV